MESGLCCPGVLCMAPPFQGVSYIVHRPWMIWVSLVPETVKNLSAMQETWIWSGVGKIPWRREWQPTPVFLPWKFWGQKSLACYSPWSPEELDMTEQHTHTHVWSTMESYTVWLWIFPLPLLIFLFWEPLLWTLFLGTECINKFIIRLT